MTVSVETEIEIHRLFFAEHWRVGTIAAQLDYLSGDDDPTDATTNAFNTLYATNHKFYGYMDYFLFIPQQLDQAGLVDGIIRAAFQLNPTTVFRADLHRFHTAEERLGETALGTEFDLIGGWRMRLRNIWVCSMKFLRLTEKPI